MNKDKLEAKIIEAKNERQNLKNQANELHTKMEIKQAEIRAMNSFIDVLEDLKKD